MPAFLPFENVVSHDSSDVDHGVSKAKNMSVAVTRLQSNYQSGKWEPVVFQKLYLRSSMMR
jgi:hypothetical protein